MLIDEPSLGLAPLIVDRVYEIHALARKAIRWSWWNKARTERSRTRTEST